MGRVLIGSLKLKQPAGISLPVSSADLVEFTPAGETGDDAVVYLLRVPTHRLEARVEAAKARAGIDYPSDERLTAELRRAIESAVDDEQQAEALDLLDDMVALKARIEAGAGEASTDPEDLREEAERLAGLSAAVQDMETQLSAVWPPLRDMHAKRVETLSAILWIVARHYLAGWCRIDLSFEAGADGLITEACLDSLPPGHVSAIAGKAFSMRHPSREQEKNSAAPSRSGSNRKRSTSTTATKRRPAAGTSAASTSTQTPAVH